jgi:hypothetical protein
MTDIDHVRRMPTPRGAQPASCPKHFGFPVPCVMCAPGPLPRAESAKRMRPPTTTAAARTRRLDAERDAAERARVEREAVTVTAPEAQEEATMARGVPTEITYNKRTQTASAWAAELGLSRVAVRKRVVSGVPLAAPKTPGAPSLAGTWDYEHDRATGAEPKKRASAKPVVHRDARPAKAIQAAKPRQRSIIESGNTVGPCIMGPAPVTKEMLGALIRAAGWTHRDVRILDREITIVELRGAA